MFYGVLIHIAYLPFFFYGINLAALHNDAHKTINTLIELRLLYIGGKELLRLISPKWGVTINFTTIGRSVIPAKTTIRLLFLKLITQAHLLGILRKAFLLNGT